MINYIEKAPTALTLKWTLISCIGLDVGDGRPRSTTMYRGTSGPQVNVPCIDVGDLRAPALLPCIGGYQAPGECTIYRCG